MRKMSAFERDVIRGYRLWKRAERRGAFVIEEPPDNLVIPFGVHVTDNENNKLMNKIDFKNKIVNRYNQGNGWEIVESPPKNFTVLYKLKRKSNSYDWNNQAKVTTGNQQLDQLFKNEFQEFISEFVNHYTTSRSKVLAENKEHYKKYLERSEDVKGNVLKETYPKFTGEVNGKTYWSNYMGGQTVLKNIFS